MQSQSSEGTWGGGSVPSSNAYMGGSPGDGLQGSWGAVTSPPPPQSQSMGSNNYDMGQQQQDNFNAQRQPMYSPGSITQYATQAQQNFYSSDGMPAEQPQATAYATGSVMGETRPLIPTASGSYASRSAQAYATTGGASIVPQQVPLPPPPMPSVSSMPTSSSVASVSDSSVIPAQQDRILTDCTRRIQEHAYYMRQAMEMDDLATVLDRASYMVGELGGAHGQSSVGSGDSHLLTPKNYYELHIRALEEMPNLEEYFINKSQQQQQAPGGGGSNYTMLQLYEYVQFCPQVLARLYLQICAGSALIRSKEVGPKWVLNDIAAVTRCVQNPTRGLFLRHFLLQAFRDKLPDQSAADAAAAATSTTSETESLMMETGTVQDAYKFVLSNFVEMNKLWVRLQHLPGEGKSKEQRKRRERERNDLRVLVGMNLVRLSQLEGVTSRVYGEIILPEVLGQVVACGDPLAQAYLMDCIIQVFPDEYHIETLPILLSVCPKLRDKVNIRTILQSLMDRLSNYYAEEELLDENDSNQVKKSLARDSLPLFEECVQNVYNARGPKLTCKEVIRLQTALLNFSIKSSPGNMSQYDHCLQVCVASLRQAVMSFNVPEGTVVNMPTDSNQIILDEASAAELDKLLAVVVDSLALKVLDLQHFSVLMTFLPMQNRKVLAVAMLRSVVQSSVTFQGVKEVNELFNVISPLFESPFVPTQVSGFGVHQQQGTSYSSPETDGDSILLARLIHLLDHEDANVAHDMLLVAKSRLSTGQHHIINRSLVALAFSALRLADNLCAETKLEESEFTKEEELDQADSNPETETETNATEKPLDGDTSDAPVSEDVKTEESTPEESDADPEELGNEEKVEAAPAIEKTEAVSGGEKSDALLSSEPITTQPSLSFRKLFVFAQQTIALASMGNAETAFKLYLQVALAGERFAVRENQSAIDPASFEPITLELLTQALALYDESISDVDAQNRCVVAMVGCLLSSQSLGRGNYDHLVTKTAQLAARTHKRQEQCQMVALCANLFFPIGRPHVAEYSNPQRALECLQRGLKLADACTSSNPSDLRLFVDLLDQYLFFFEHNNPVISDAYISGLISLIREHLQSQGGGSNATTSWDAREQFQEIVRYIKRKKEDSLTKDRFGSIQVDF